jgi:saccharopine dehydrogenase-like NADP-dependent oxidoreductase
MRALDDAARRAAVALVNEVGLDPGIDHLSAQQIIDRVQAKGETVDTFISWCGGLPAPQDRALHGQDNPFGYKFSWEPKGALSVLLNTATYLHAGHKQCVQGQDLMKWARPVHLAGLDLEGYPNRNSILYKDIYGLKNVRTLLRGTLRYPGFCAIMQGAKNLGLMQMEPHTDPSTMLATTWGAYISELNEGVDLDTLKQNMDKRAWDALHWLGCFSGEPAAQTSNPLDAFCELLLRKLSYGAGERDMVLLVHKFIIKRPDGSKYYITSQLKAFGEVGGHSAMAHTVGTPVAIAAQLIAQGIITRRGVVRPVSEDIYVPMLRALEQEGIVCEERIFEDGEISEHDFTAEIV